MKKIVALLLSMSLLFTFVSCGDKIRPELKEAMEGYEGVIDEYCEFVKEYSESDDPVSMLSDYFDILGRYTDAMAGIAELTKGEFQDEPLTDEEKDYVKEVSDRINEKIAGIAEDIPETTPEPEEESEIPDDTPIEYPDAVDGIRPEFKASMDAYEKFFDDYVNFLTTFAQAEDTTEMLGQYAEFMTNYAQTMEDLEKIESGEYDGTPLTAEEDAYFLEVYSRIMQKLAEVPTD